MEIRQIRTNIAKINFSMPNSKEIFEDVIRRISINESADEISQIAYLLLEHLFGLSRTSVIQEKIISSYSSDVLDAMIDRINLHEPLQYVIGEADFYGRKFFVNPSVLIPRPETEQLVYEVIRVVGKSFKGNVLDIGTGCGCIAITLANEIPEIKVIATDISNCALATAEANAKKNDAAVSFIQSDILTNNSNLPRQDVIVSNPPYIRPSEKKSMQENVLAHEPQEALFVPEDNPLIFYSAIAQSARTLLTADGYIFVEINEAFGRETAALFTREGFTRVLVLKDLQGKDRIVIAQH